MVGRSVFVGAMVSVVMAAEAAAAFEPLTVETEHYLYKTDVPREKAKEAFVRLDRAYEDYEEVLSGTGRKVSKRLNAAFFANRNDMAQVTGEARFPGVYLPREKSILFTLFAENMDYTWNMLQHEAFHQYVDFSVGELPTWINEGIATYYGSAVYTGDSYVKGRIIPGNLTQLKQMITNNSVVSFPAFITVKQAGWNRVYEERLYVQAWAMVHFLKHADGGIHNERLEKYLLRVSEETAKAKFGRDETIGHRVWREVFGRNEVKFEARWKEWALALTEKENVPVMRQANVLTVLSGMERAVRKKVNFGSAEGFAEMVRRNGPVVIDTQKDYLPPELISKAVAEMEPGSVWEVKNDEGKPALTVRYKDGMMVRGWYVKEGPYLRTASEVVGQGAPAKAIAATRPGATMRAK